MITLRGVELARGARSLARNVSLAIHGGSRIGVIGPNGCGKSSLLAALADELQPQSGEIEMPPGVRIAQVAQETAASRAAAIDYVLDGDAELRSTQAALAAAEHNADADALAELHQAMEHIDGYSAQSRAARLLHGLGFAVAAHARPVAEFSGGWRMRLNLARALFAPSDLLLLDEPTNHLDLDAVIWLERFLAAYGGTLLLVSHDRDFLDAVVDRVLSFEAGTIIAYTGNYSAFEEARAQALAHQQAAHAKQQRRIAHLRGFIDRFRAKATKARQAQSRLKALARMERIAPAHADTPFSFEFAAPQAAPNPLIVLDRAHIGYGDRRVLENVSIAIMPGSRIGLLGRNGAGKSTLVKALAGELAIALGERRAGRGLAIGYFAQHQLEHLRSDETPLQHLLRMEPQAREQELRDFLGRFGFGGDQALAPVGPFSGGERSRLALALIVRARPNLLLLDEPTNHLDLDMRHALTLALQEYAGAVVLVSHDRHLVRTSVDELWLTAGGRVQRFDGDLDDYRSWLQAHEDPAAEGAAGARPARSAERRRMRAQRQDELAARRRPLQAEARTLEDAIGALEKERASIDATLASSATYRSASAADIESLHKRRAAIETRLVAIETRWFEVQQAIDALNDETRVAMSAERR